MAFSSRFEVMITPPKRRDSDGFEETPVLDFRPFASIPKVIFKNVAVGNCVSRSIVLKNPQSQLIEVELVKLPPQDVGLSFSEKKIHLQPHQEAVLVINWQPKKEGKCIHSINLKTNTNSRHHFSIVCVSIQKKPLKKTGKPTIQRTALKKKVMLRSSNGKSVDKDESKIYNKPRVPNKTQSQIPTYTHRNKVSSKISEEVLGTNFKKCSSFETKSTDTKKVDVKCVELLDTIEDVTNFSSETYDLGSPEIRNLRSPSVEIVSNTFQNIKTDNDFLSDIGFSPLRPSSQKASRETYILVPKVSYLSCSNREKLPSLPENVDISCDSLFPDSPPEKRAKSCVPAASAIPRDSLDIELNLQTTFDKSYNMPCSKINQDLDLDVSKLLEVEDLITKKHLKSDKVASNLEFEVSNLTEVENLLAQRQVKSKIESEDNKSFVSSCSRIKRDYLDNELAFFRANDPSFNNQLPKENKFNFDISNLGDESLVTKKYLYTDREDSNLDLDISDLTEVENMLAKKYKGPNAINNLELSIPPIIPLSKLPMANEEFSRAIPQRMNEHSFEITQNSHKASQLHSFQITPLRRIGNGTKFTEVTHTQQMSVKETSQAHISFSTPLEKHLPPKSEQVTSAYGYDKENYNCSVNQRCDVQSRSTLSCEISPIYEGHSENSLISTELGKTCRNVFKEPKAKISLTYSSSQKPFTAPVENTSCRFVKETKKLSAYDYREEKGPEHEGMETVPNNFNNKEVSSNLKYEENSASYQAEMKKYLTFSPPPKLGHSKVKENISPPNTSLLKREQKFQKVVTPFQARKDSVQQVLRESQRKKEPSRPISKLLLSSKGKRSSQKKRTLIDPHKILSEQSNPSYCITSTTINPFLNSAVYYDMQWIDAREKEFVRWLNVLLTPPEQLSSSDELPKVDVADLWKRSCKADVAPAPSRETVSSLYLVNHRLDSLRRKACTMFSLPSVAQVLSKVVIQIEKGILSIRKDRNIVRDIGLKCLAVELLLCYNPLWLRIGLETIMGRTIPLESNSDVVGITGFIARHFLSDPYLAQQYSYSGVTNMFKPGYEEAVKKHILKKFFLLVFFLDFAKENKLIVHNPCLFCKDAQYKESRDLLLAFAREFLAGIGDVTKHLKCLGYVVKHKQTYLDEFNYAVTHLGSDLRDGIRLTKVAEIILQKSSLSSTLRTPPISKLQKMHNVKVSLQALCGAGHKIEGDISAKDIVEGHKEKTMSLLWQIIYRFQITRFTSAAYKIQKWFRSLSVFIKRRIWLKKEAAKRQVIEDKASTVIQKHWRSYIARKQYRICVNSVCKIQKWLKSIILMRSIRAQFLRKREAAVMIQRFVRLKNNFTMKQVATVKIQRWYRSARLMNYEVSVFQTKRTAARIIQYWFRSTLLMRQEKATFQKIRLSAIKIQSWVRATVLMRKERTIFLNKKYAVIKIQRYYKALIIARQERELFIVKRTLAIKIQRWYRKILCMKLEQQTYFRQKCAAVIIQRWWRSTCLTKQLRFNFVVTRKSAISIQNWYRGAKCMKELRKTYLVKRNATIKIQQWYRSTVVMHFEKKTYEKKKSAIRTIQSVFRSTIEMRRQKAEYEKMRLSAIKIQTLVRARFLMRNQRTIFLKQRNAAIKIQRFYRGLILAQRARELFSLKRMSAITIQRWFRKTMLMKLQQHSYLRQKHAAVIIQRWWRSTYLTKLLRSSFVSKRNSALRIQKWLRSIMYMKKERTTYLVKLNAALKIQEWYRSSKLSRHEVCAFQRKKAAVIIIQHWFRSIIQMRHEKAIYEKIRSSAVKIQIWIRATIFMKKERKLYLAQKHAAVKIQSTYKALILMRLKREQFILYRWSAIVIQRWYRNMLLMKLQQNMYRRQKNAVVTIQRWWRFQRVAIQLKSNSVLESKSAIKIQKWYNSTMCMRKQRIYLRKQNAASKIQRWYRSSKIMHHDACVLHIKKTAVRIIQSWFRSTVQMKRDKAMYQTLRLSAIKIQTWVRATILMRKERNLFLAQRNASVKIQRTYRALMHTRQEREFFILNRKSAILIQRWYRTVMCVKHERQLFFRKKCAAMVIQKWWRCTCLAKQIRFNFVVKRQSAIKIQEWYRATKSMREQRRIYLSIQGHEITVQRKLRALQLKKERLRQRSPEIVDDVQLENLRLNGFAIKIQACWRGYTSRKRLKAVGLSTVDFGMKYALDVTLSLRAIYDKAIQDFCSSTTYAVIINAAYGVETCVRLVCELCETFFMSQHLDTLIYLMKTSNRSVPAEELLIVLVKILTHVIRHPDGVIYLMKIDDFIPTLITLTNIWNGKRNEILFCTLCTAWWLLAQNKDSYQVLSEMKISSLLVKWYKKVKIWQRENKLCPKVKNHLPIQIPTWLLGSGDQPLYFTSGLFAITELLRLFNIAANQVKNY